jgi:hypothetical protein
MHDRDRSQTPGLIDSDDSNATLSELTGNNFLKKQETEQGGAR